jgi:hypothetical protein
MTTEYLLCKRPIFPEGDRRFLLSCPAGGGARVILSYYRKMTSSLDGTIAKGAPQQRGGAPLNVITSMCDFYRAKIPNPNTGNMKSLEWQIVRDLITFRDY